jgi:ABC-type branched-subunit amino acid transport system permease subunit
MLGRLRGSLLCRREAPISTVKDVIGWWEARRVPFNLVVGIAGVVSCVVAGPVVLGSYLLGVADLAPDPPLFAVFGIILYAIGANVCFTGGWITELIIRKIWPHEADRFATLSFSFGLVFSILLTLTPSILLSALGIFGLIAHIFHIAPPD